MMRLFGRADLVKAALWAAFLYVVFALMALAIAPSAGRAAEPPQALVVRLARHDDPKVQSWRLVTDLEAPIGSETGPAVTSMACAVSAATRLALWLGDHMPGWDVTEWRCLPVNEAERFLETGKEKEI